MAAMRLIDRYVARVVLLTTLMALLVLLAVDLLFLFANEAQEIGSGSYTLAKVMHYVALQTPAHLHRLFPMALLLGSLLGLGSLVDSSEVIAMRAAGVSILGLGKAVLKAGLVLLVAAALIGEFVAPPMEQAAERLRVGALTGQVSLRSERGFWARDRERIVSIHEVLPGARLRDVRVYEFTPERALSRTIQAASAQVREGRWELDDVRIARFDKDRVVIERRPQEAWSSLLNPNLIRLVVSRPDQLSARDLWQYIRYQEANDLDATDYRVAFWERVLAPFGGLSMLLLSLPFVFAPQRSLTMGHRLLVGVLGGLGFFLLSRGFSQMGQLYGLSPILSAAAPVLLISALGLIGLTRVR